MSTKIKSLPTRNGQLKDFPKLFDGSPSSLALVGGIETEVVPTGSRYNCNPPIMNTDEDFLVWFQTNDHVTLFKFLIEIGYVRSSSENDSLSKFSSGEFTSWRRGDTNLIITGNQKFFNLHKLSGQVCKKLNLMNKPDRIMVYHAIMYGEYDEGREYADKVSSSLSESKDDIDWFALNKMFA
jgi:hypothetical protein